MSNIGNNTKVKINKVIKTLPSFPSMVVASITNKCSHACIDCPYRKYSADKNYEEHHMAFRVFKKIVDEMTYYPESILRICAWGEPCAHPDIINFVKYTNHRIGNTVLLTNGYYLGPTLANELMAAGLKLIEISIDAATIETYRKIRYCRDKDAFHTVVNNARNAIQKRNNNSRQFKTRIVVSYVTWPTVNSENEYLEFEKQWKGFADDVVKRRLTSFCGSVNPEQVEIPENRLPCYGLWARCNINPWGKIQICYNQWEKDKWVLGDLNESDVTIHQIWKSPEFDHLREEQLNGKYLGPCESCIDYNPYAWDHPFEEVYFRVVKKLW